MIQQSHFHGCIEKNWKQGPKRYLYVRVQNSIIRSAQKVEAQKVEADKVSTNRRMEK